MGRASKCVIMYNMIMSHWLASCKLQVHPSPSRMRGPLYNCSSCSCGYRYDAIFVIVVVSSTTSAASATASTSTSTSTTKSTNCNVMNSLVVLCACSHCSILASVCAASVVCALTLRLLQVLLLLAELPPQTLAPKCDRTLRCIYWIAIGKPW